MFKNRLALTKNRNIIAIILSIIIFGIIFLIVNGNVLYIFDKKVSDLYFKFNNTIINKDIRVIEIDEDTLSGRNNSNGTLELEGLGRFPFDRKYYATVIDNLNEAGAAVIALDIIFGEKSDVVSDDLLSNSIKNSGNVITGIWTNSTGHVKFPYEKFGKYLLTTGYLSPKIDKATNVAYSIQPYGKFKGSDDIFDHFSIAILRGFYSKIYNDDKYLTQKHEFTPEKIHITDKIELIRSSKGKNELIINYYNDKHNDKFYTSSFIDIYNNKFDKSYFKDKIVIIGAAAKGIKDVVSTPLGIQYGVYTHVNMINTILTKNGLVYLEKNIELLLIFLLIIVSVYFNISKSSYVLILSNIALISFFILSTVYITILTNTLLNYPVELLIAFILSLTISNIVKYLIENKNKDRLNKALSEYVSEDVAREILSGEGKINLDGEEKEIAIFFSDIEGFTSISEKFAPKELVGFLREYLSDMSNIILDEGGFINKYEGDAIMALWGVFGNNTLEPYEMCLAALKQQEALVKLNFMWSKRGLPVIKTRIGLHFGSAIIGNIGAEGRKMEFTALGDSVNLASRLEGVNKHYGTYICASENIYYSQKDYFEFRFLDKIKVIGKDEPIKIYELIALKGKLLENKEELYFNFKIAIGYYQEKNFLEALTKFTKLAELGDPPSITYMKRCEVYINNPPSNSWDGIWSMESK